MSCPDELVRWLYVEGELAASELRGFESHLVTCQACRAAVVGLREESDLLADVLLERARPERARPRRSPVPRPRSPEPGVVIGLPAAIAAVTAAFAAVGFLIEASLPGGLDPLNPLRLEGAYEMAFDLVFLLQDRAPGLVEVALSLGGVAAVSALLTFAAGALYRRVYGATAALLVALASFAPDPAAALEIRTHQETRIAASEVVGESMLLTGDAVHVDGVIQGDLIASADRVTIRGTVEGSLYVLTRDLEIEGVVAGNVHGAVKRTRIDGEVKGSVYQFGERIDLGSGGKVGRDFSLMVARGSFGGEIGRDLVFAGDDLEVRGRIGRNVEVHAAESIVLGDGADVAGDVEARLSDEGDLERADGARIGGELRFLPPEGLDDLYRGAYRNPWVYLAHGLSLVAAFLFGLLLYALAPQLYEVELHTAPQFLRAMLYGFIGAVAIPVAVIALALTVVGIPVAVLGLFIFVVAIYSAEIVVGAWIGSSLLPPADESFYAFGRTLFLGLLILTVATHIPYLGPAVAVVAALLGLGLILTRARGAVRIE
jgi:cytoskeletal protein CcmA (bactofilin family)